mmetsp:Transcript_54889/g.116620  ORF Transcript_54889/g.116620 Transcript_54889/m.116620 type:complete len:104 (+) Transcript_54889:796-1107(+)
MAPRAPSPASAVIDAGGCAVAALGGVAVGGGGIAEKERTMLFCAHDVMLLFMATGGVASLLLDDIPVGTRTQRLVRVVEKHRLTSVLAAVVIVIVEVGERLGF